MTLRKQKTTKKRKTYKTHPSAGLNQKQKSDIVKQAKKGRDFGKKGKNFKEVEANAYKFYKSKGYNAKDSRDLAKETAGSIFWGIMKKRKNYESKIN